MSDSLIDAYDRAYERDTTVAVSITREHWLKISDRITQLRQELSLAEEGLANYQQELENAKHDIERLTAAASAETTEVERLRAALRKYGHHHSACEWALTDGAPCICGLLAAIEGSRVPQTVPQSDKT